MTVAHECATFDATAFTQWCDRELYTPAIRQGTQILDLACDIHLMSLYRQLAFTQLLAAPRTARELSDGLGFGFPAEARLAMDPRTRDFVKINGRPYEREPLDEQWALARFPADLGAARHAA